MLEQEKKKINKNNSKSYLLSMFEVKIGFAAKVRKIINFFLKIDYQTQTSLKVPINKGFVKKELRNKIPRKGTETV